MDQIGEDSLHVNPAALLLSRTSDNHTEVFFPPMLVANTVKAFFNDAGTLFTSTGCLHYDLWLSPSPFGDLLLPAGEPNHSSGDTFSHVFLDALDSRDMLGLVPSMVRLLRRELSGAAADGEHLGALRSAAERALVRGIAAFSGGFFGEVNFRCARWNEYVRWFCDTTADRRVSPASSKALLNVVVGLALSTNPLLLEVIVGTTARLLAGFRRELRQDVEGAWVGAVVYAAAVRVGDRPHALVLSRGMLQLLLVRALGKRAQPLPDAYAVPKGAVRFSGPLRDLVFVPLPERPQKGVIISHGTHFVLDFPHGDMTDFFVCFTVCREEALRAEIEPVRPRFGSARIRVGVDARSVVGAVEMEGEAWRTAIDRAAFQRKLEAIAQRGGVANAGFRMVTLIEPEYSSEVRGLRYGTREFLSVIELPPVDQLEASIISAITLDFCVHPSPEICFHALHVFGVSDFLKAFELESARILDLQIASFAQFLPRELLQNTPVSHLASLLSTRLHLIQRVVAQCGPAAVAGDGRNALFYAIPSFTRAVPQLLLECGVEVAQPDHLGSTPMAFAIAQGVPEIERFLYAFPSRATAGEGKFAAALHAIARARDLPRFVALLPHLGRAANEPVSGSQYLLHLLIDAGMPQAVGALVGVAGFNPNRSSRNFVHPLHYLITRKCATREWADALLALPALDVNARNPQSKPRGQTPLCAAVAAQELRLVEALIGDARCRVDLPNGAGQTPLWLAAASDATIVDLLIGAGADVNAPGSDGETPLMKVSEMASGDALRGEIVQRLVRAGANPRLWYARGRLPVHVEQAAESDGLPSFADGKF